MRPKVRRARQDGPTALYRLYDGGGGLLYVGISHRPRARWGEHAKDKRWWPAVADASLTWYDTRAYAMLAEQAAIESEGPAYNATISPQSVPPPPGGRMPLAELYRLCDAYRAAHRALADAVVAEAARGTDVARIARSVDWTREYIARIRKERDAKSQAAGQPADPRSPKRPDSSAASSDVDPST